jgi:hypothetical protein
MPLQTEKFLMISKLLKNNFIWIVLTLALTSFSYTIFFGWGLMVGVFSILFWVFRLTKLEDKLTAKEHQLYLLTMFLYPIIETGIQWMATHNIISRDFTIINRLEHISWAMVMTFMFLPINSGTWKRLNLWQNFIYIVAFVCLLGNLNEFLEYFSRVHKTVINPVQFAGFYTDSIFDMMMNILGSLVGFFVLSRIDVGRDDHLVGW